MQIGTSREEAHREDGVRMNISIVRWGPIAITFAWCLALGLVWNLVVMYYMASAKIPISAKILKMSHYPWGISLFCLGVIVFFLLQAMVASVVGGDVLIFDGEQAARRIAITFGYPVRPSLTEPSIMERLRRLGMIEKE